MIVTITECLKKLEYEESKKTPQERRDVPTITEIAKAAEMFPQSVNKSIKGMEENLDGLINRKVIDATVRVLRSKGFDVGINDVVRFVD